MKYLFATQRLTAALLFTSTMISLAAAKPNLEEGIQKAIDKLSESPNLIGKNVAVGTIKNATGQPTALSALIANAAEASLSEKALESGFKVSDRSNFNELVKEWALGQTGMVDEETATQAGKLCGISQFCFGSYAASGKETTVWLKIVDAEKGTVSASTEFKCKLNKNQQAMAEKPIAPPADPKPNKGLSVKVWTDKTKYKEGDKLAIHFEASEDCYLTLIDINPRGEAIVIFPNDFNRNNRIESGRVYTIPNDEMGFDFITEPPYGVDILKAIASREPIISLKEVFDSIDELKPFAGIEDPAMLTRGIRVEGRKAKPGAWAEAATRYTIEE